MLTASRSLVVLLLLAWQAVASGVGGLAHLCGMRAAPSHKACCCPHADRKQGEAVHAARAQPAAAGVALRADGCDTQQPQRLLTPSARTDSAYAAASWAAPAVPAPAWLAPVALAPTAPSALAQLEPYRGQGPPLFLRIRSLLI